MYRELITVNFFVGDNKEPAFTRTGNIAFRVDGVDEDGRLMTTVTEIEGSETHILGYDRVETQLIWQRCC